MNANYIPAMADIAINISQKAWIKAHNMRLTDGLLALLILAYWRMKVQPEVVHYFSQRQPGGKQTIIHVVKHAATLYKWMREAVPGGYARAFVQVGIETWESLEAQGYTTEQIRALQTETRKQIWGTTV